MKEIIKKAIGQTRGQMKKKTIKKVPMDLFARHNDTPFNFVNDPILKIKKPKQRSTNLAKWKSTDFLTYLKENIAKSFIRLDAYDKRQIIMLQDRITKNLEFHTHDKNSRCDNLLLKKYIDWWLLTYRPQIGKGKIYIDSVCNEKNVREFFQADAWKATEPTQMLPEIIKRPQGSRKTYFELYDAGGLNKLIYEAGIIDSFDFLVREKSKPPVSAAKELRTVLNSLHPAVFEHILKKTFLRAPYQERKQFDVYKIVKTIIKKRNLDYNEMMFGSLFEKGEEI